MNLTKTLKSVAVASTVTLVTLISASAAQAFSFTFTPGQTTTNPQATTFNLPAAFPSLTGGQVVNGDKANQYLRPGSNSGAPIGNLVNYLTVGGNDPLAPTATFDFGQAIDYFGLYWGSIDSYNTIRFLNGTQVVASYTGDVIANAINSSIAIGSIGNFGIDQYVNFFADSDSEVFDKVEFISTQAAFESGNFAYKVPTPALLPGLMGMGVAALRRKKDETAEENA